VVMTITTIAVMVIYHRLIARTGHPDSPSHD
jgi:hypothetical protein